MNFFKKIFLSLPIYLFSFLVPKVKNKWVFIGWHRTNEGEVFSDNTKYFYLYSSHKNDDVTWLTKNKQDELRLQNLGINAHYEGGFRGIISALRADKTFIDAYIQRQNIQFSGGSKIVQLLHGKGLKKKGYGKKIFRKNDYIFGTSKYALELLPKSFTNNSIEVVSGFPRNDIFFNRPDEKVFIDTDEAIVNIIADHKKQGVGIIFYAPTFRRGVGELDFSKILNLNTLNNFLKKSNLVMIASLHPKLYNNVKNLDAIFFLKQSDPYPLLQEADLLITDYSSLFVDFLLLDKPIIFFPFDFDEYEALEGFCVDYEGSTPGIKVYEQNSLQRAILEEVTNPNNYSEQRLKIRNLYHEYQDGKSSERIFEKLYKN